MNLKDMQASPELDKMVAKALGWCCYTGAITGGVRAIDERGIDRAFEPSQYDDHALLVVDELILRGYDVYLYYKQPTVHNIECANFGHVCEIRQPKGILISSALADTRALAICLAAIDARIDNGLPEMKL